jgi:hypothetical protein
MTPPGGSYDAAFIRVTSTLGMRKVSEAFKIGSPVAAVSGRGIAEGYSIMNFPNPFGGATTISFTVPARGLVKITVADGMGREVGTVAWRNFEAGSHILPFDASRLPAGIYNYTLQAGKVRVAGMMTVVK